MSTSKSSSLRIKTKNKDSTKLIMPTTPDTLTLGYSPCPNDTFMFHALATGGLTLPGQTFSIRLEDVETLNQLALAATLDISKMSFHAWLRVRENYRLLASGAALGRGCGPILVTRKKLTRADLPDCRIVLPGELTTAHLLFQLYAPEAANKTFVSYESILPQLDSGAADCGVIIHENRFTFAAAGFHAIADLGDWWEQETSLPIPLGCIAIRKSLGENLAHQVESLIRESIATATANPTATHEYVHTHAQEISAAVLDKHIATFVNEFSLDLGDEGQKAVAELERRARNAGICQ